MDKFKLNGQEYIQLNDLLKIFRWAGTGGEANVRISSGEVKVNGETETRRRKKLRTGDVVEFAGNAVKIEP